MIFWLKTWTMDPPPPVLFFVKKNTFPRAALLSFWENVMACLKAFVSDIQEDYSLDTNLAPSLRPDPSKFNQQVDFCFITARRYIWLCKTNELTLTLHGYLKYMKLIHRIHNHQTASQSLPKEWTFLNGILNFNHLLVPRSPMPLIILLYILAFFSFYNECCLC